MDDPKAAPGWYPDDSVPGQQRYWDGAAWTSHTAPVDAPPPGAAAMPSAITGSTLPCPYCKSSMPETAVRCPSCGGEQRYCKRCDDLVGVWSKQKFVGLARGGTKTQYRCMNCNTVVDGPRW
jgi:hypothetical protein